MITRPLARFLPRAASAPRPATPRRRSARRALLWGAVGILLAHIGLALAVETVLPHVRDPEYGHRENRVLAQQRKHPDRPLVLMIGTSRAQNALDVSAMGFPDEPGSPLVFNAGLSGTRPINLPLNFHRFRDAGVRPAAVLVELFPATLVVTGPAEGLFVDTVPRLTAADVRRLEPHLADPAAFRRKWAYSRVNSWHALRSVVIGNLAPEWHPWHDVDHTHETMDPFGFTPFRIETVTPEFRQRMRALAERTYAYVLRKMGVSAMSDRAYRDLVADCRAAGIPVAFFITPESPTFRGWYTPESRAVLDAFTHMLSDELGCPVFAAPTDFGEEDFVDGHHILRPAAAKYSKWLADTHLKPWLGSIR